MTDVNSQQEKVFEYRVTKDQKVLIYWNNRLVTTLANQKAQKFLSQIRQDGSDAQLVMARFTGNFKRGNERDNKNSD